jgi:hypothetical protein
MNNRRWLSIAVLFLAVALALPAHTAADDKGKGDRDEGDHHEGGGGGDKGVCSPRPAGCKKEDCRCEDKKTCTECREFVCRRGKKKPPVVVCRPCCMDKKGKVKCSPAPEEDDRKCVPSPS